MPVGITTGAQGADQRAASSGGFLGLFGSRESNSVDNTAVVQQRSLSGGKDITVEGNVAIGDLNSTSGPSTIRVANSSDLNALAEAVTLASTGNPLTISGSQYSRPTGSGGIAIDLGTTHQRTLSLANSSFAADVIKARSYATDGRDALVVDGSRFDASQLIRLYADGQSTLRFKGQVQLNAPRTDLAAQKVTIDAGSRVTASGNVNVYTDNADFDKPGRGSLDAAGTKATQPHAQRPSRF